MTEQQIRHGSSTIIEGDPVFDITIEAGRQHLSFLLIVNQQHLFLEHLGDTSLLQENWFWVSAMMVLVVLWCFETYGFSNGWLLWSIHNTVSSFCQTYLCVCFLNAYEGPQKVTLEL